MEILIEGNIPVHDFQMLCKLIYFQYAPSFWRISIRYQFVLFKPVVWLKNDTWCRILHVFTTYFMLTTYFWMLCEGAFLRMILVKTFIKEEFWIALLAVVGWIIPAFLVIPYVAFRHFYENEVCWMDRGTSILFLAIPVIIVIFTNVCFLCSVISVLRTKLIFENSFNKKNDVTLKSARAVLILVPIFGLHFVLLPMRPEVGSNLEYVYEVISSITTSTQGLSVSFLLCFCNNDIAEQIKKTLHLLLSCVSRICPQYLDEYQEHSSFWTRGTWVLQQNQQTTSQLNQEHKALTRTSCSYEKKSTSN